MKEWLFKQVGKGVPCVLSEEDQSDPNLRYTVSSLLLPRCQYVSAQFLNSGTLQRELLQSCPTLEGTPNSFLLHFHPIFGDL